MLSCKELQFDYNKKQISQNWKKNIFNSVKIYRAPHQHKNTWGVYCWFVDTRAEGKAFFSNIHYHHLESIVAPAQDNRQRSIKLIAILNFHKYFKKH